MKETEQQPAKCGLCDGQKVVWHKSHGKETKSTCPSCHGSGVAEDRLRKVMPMTKPDFVG